MPRWVAPRPLRPPLAAPPVLRFDETGEADKLPPLLQKAQQEKLSADEAKLLAEALRRHQPWLEWAGKREQRWFDVDPVALHRDVIR